MQFCTKAGGGWGFKNSPLLPCLKNPPVISQHPFRAIWPRPPSHLLSLLFSLTTMQSPLAPLTSSLFLKLTSSSPPQGLCTGNALCLECSISSSLAASFPSREASPAPLPPRHSLWTPWTRFLLFVALIVIKKHPDGCLCLSDRLSPQALPSAELLGPPWSWALQSSQCLQESAGGPQMCSG